MIPSTMDVKNPYPRYSMYGIFTYMYHEKWPNVGKYTSPMDAMGFEMLGKCSNVRVANAEPGPGLGGCGKMGLNQHSSHLCFFGSIFGHQTPNFSKNGISFRKDLPQIIQKKHSLWVCSSSPHPKKSTLVCPHRSEHGKNSQLHILQSFAESHMGANCNGCDKTFVAIFDIVWMDFFQANKVKLVFVGSMSR